MVRLPPLPSVRELVRLYGLQARQQLSQNFLFDLNLCKKFARSLAPPEAEQTVTTEGVVGGVQLPPVVLEVGPGPGGLTRSVLALGGGSKAMVAVEMDSRFIPALNMLLQQATDVVSSSTGRTEASGAASICETAHVIQDDCMRVDEHELLKEYAREMPLDHDGYSDVGVIDALGGSDTTCDSVATELLLKWTRQVAEGTGIARFGRVPMVLSFQTEVADRIIAEPNSRKYGRLSVMSQMWLEPQDSFIIAAKNFVPPPKVDATVVRLAPRPAPLSSEPVSFLELEKVTKDLFAQRRKVVAKILSSFPAIRASQDPSLAVGSLLLAAKVDGRKRPEQLDVCSFARLTRHYMQQHPKARPAAAS